MRSMMFARTFPTSHPRKGEPTRFVEKIWAGLADDGYLMDRQDFRNYQPDIHIYYTAKPKVHTIRAGLRWKEGDRFSPRYWEVLPYRSPQAIFAPALQVKRIWSIQIWPSGHVIIDGKAFGELLDPSDEVKRLATNDGLSVDDMAAWFRDTKPFDGQIICWNKNIEYFA